ncbi:MAG: glycyl-radical enzyme activating protein [Tepidanaerobacteraceae bacterium]|jgi:pyruvate formate lyase activating enzyme|nr:glycyl-radical enzyme activating protein [Tepidanaerobacteraceae bacterium]
MSSGIICEIERYAISDGPGIRTLVFIKGCPLRCKWCSNPETQRPLPEIYYHEDACTFCRRCIKACPCGAIKADDVRHKVVTDRDICKGCGRCVPACPARARSIVGVFKTVQELMEEIKKDLTFYESSGGGVTLSGGEMLFSHDFALEVLKACKEEYIDTAIETSGYASWDVLEKLLPYVDHVLIDIKHMDPISHKQWTGVSNDLILDNIKKIDAKGKDYVLRVPLIPGINDGEENIKRLKSFTEELNNLHEIHLLPYHALGRIKYTYLERAYELGELKKHTKDEINKIASMLHMKEVKVIIGG